MVAELPNGPCRVLLLAVVVALVVEGAPNNGIAVVLVPPKDIDDAVVEVVSAAAVPVLDPNEKPGFEVAVVLEPKVKTAVVLAAVWNPELGVDEAAVTDPKTLLFLIGAELLDEKEKAPVEAAVEAIVVVAG